MAFNLTDRALTLASKTNKNIQLVVRIEGYDKLFTTLPNTQLWKIGDPYLIGQTGLIIGGVIESAYTEPLVTFEGTTNTISQQLKQDKSGASSVSNLTVAIIDQNGAISAELNALTPDVLSRRCDVYLGFQQGFFPQDFTPIFIGVISNFSATVGTVNLKIVNPERLKEQDIFFQVSGETTNAVNDSQTTIHITEAASLLLPGNILTCYIRIDDEIIKYDSTNSTSILTCTRGAFFTTPTAHDINATYDSFYVLEDNPIDMALKVMLSKGGNYVDGALVERINIDRIYIANTDFANYHNIQVGDLITTTGFTTPENNLTNEPVLGIEVTDLHTVIRFNITTPKTEELPVNGQIFLKSHYDVLSEGCGMLPHEVDIEQHLYFHSRIGAAMPIYKIFLKKTIRAKEFIDGELYFPTGCYSLPRKGRVSLGFATVPTSDVNTRVLNKSNIINASKIILSRSTEQMFYNAIVYRYDESHLTDKFLRGKITISASSQNKIRVGNKPLVIDSKGLRYGSEYFIASQTDRFLDRYQFGAEGFKVEVAYGAGWAIEVGDAVIFDGADLNIFDSKSNTRQFAPRVMEVVNKSMSIKTGQITLELLDTSFSVSGRYVAFAPSSELRTGSTTTIINLANSLSLKPGEIETERWSPFVGEKVRIYAPDFTTIYETRLRGVQGGLTDASLIVDAVATAPSVDWVVTPATYDNLARNKFKSLFGYWGPVVYVTSGINNTSFIVDDPTPLFIGCYVRVERIDFTVVSSDLTVTDILGSTITVSGDLGFTPDNTYMLTLIGFTDDDGLSYRYS